MTDPIQFFRDEFPAIFSRGVALLRAEAEAGDENAKANLEDVAGADGAGYLNLEGAGELWFVARDGVVSATDTRPDGVPVRMAVTLPAEAAEVGLEEIRRHVDLGTEGSARRATMLVSKKLEDALAGESLEFTFTLKDTPDFEAVKMTVGINAQALPVQPKFSVEMKWDDFEKAQGGELSPQQLFMGGKLKFGGDYSRALQLAMTMAQDPRYQRKN